MGSGTIEHPYNVSLGNSKKILLTQTLDSNHFPAGSIDNSIEGGSGRMD